MSVSGRRRCRALALYPETKLQDRRCSMTFLFLQKITRKVSAVNKSP
jgi:hypothetical protein